jgi:putative endonuclease
MAQKFQVQMSLSHYVKSSPSFRRKPESSTVYDKGGFVYILASRRNGTLYVSVAASLDVSVAASLERRIVEHKSETYAGFTKRYAIKMLLWYESFGRIEDAIHREKQIKDWKRVWKLELIEKANPDWADLSADWFNRGAGGRLSPA